MGAGLCGFLRSGSGAQLSTGRWSDGSMTWPSGPMMGSSCDLFEGFVAAVDFAAGVPVTGEESMSPWDLVCSWFSTCGTGLTEIAC